MSWGSALENVVRGKGEMFMGCNVKRAIDPCFFTQIPRFRELIKTLPEQRRACSECGKEVAITPEAELSQHQGDGPPFVVEFMGCDGAIDRVKAEIGMID